MKKSLCILLILTMVFSFAYADADVNAVYQSAAQFIQKSIPEPTVSSIGGEWTVIGLARSGADISQDYFEKYYANLENYLKSKNGILHDKKYTEYSRVILALTAIGKNPENVCGYNLLAPLADFENTLWQGTNGAVWALIALDSKNYEIPKDSENIATRDMYVKKILSLQNRDGGWSLNGDGSSDVDVTAMALCALAKYQSRSEVENAVNAAVLFLSESQNESGGFSTYGVETSESVSQVICALCTLKISLKDTRFVKNGKTALDNLMTFYDNNGAFYHTSDKSGSSQMATEQALCAISAVKRFNENKNSIYDMTDVEKNFDILENTGLQNRNSDITKQNIICEKTFADISDHNSRLQIEALANRGIINGKSNEIFDPDSNVTRAEFAAIISKALGITKTSEINFYDVAQSDWYYNAVSVCCNYGIVKGISENEFNPDGFITKEEAAVMIARGAALCGFESTYSEDSARDILAAFDDYITVSDWAKNSLAFCYEKNILPISDIEINPQTNATRAQIAVMTYNLLNFANLL